MRLLESQTLQTPGDKPPSCIPGRSSESWLSDCLGLELNWLLLWPEHRRADCDPKVPSSLRSRWLTPRTDNPELWDKFLRVEPLTLVQGDCSHQHRGDLELRATVAAPGSLRPSVCPVCAAGVRTLTPFSSTPRCPGMTRPASRDSHRGFPVARATSK